MSTFHNTVWDKKLPPFSGLVLVVILFATIATLTSNVVLFSTKAAAGATPKKVQISNVTDTSFTVTYLTDDPVLGTIDSGKDTSLGTISLDDRDLLTNKPEKHRLHYITVKNLSPATKYVFEITSGGETFKNNETLFEVNTAPTVSTPSTTQGPLKGQVILDDGAIPVEGIVMVAADGSQMLSAMLKPDGSYEVPLNLLRTSDLTSRFATTETTQLHVTIVDPTQQATATVLANQVDPVPLMTLSKDYDFAVDSSIAEDSAASEAAATTPALPIPIDTAPVTAPEIITPKNDQSFNDLQPTFDGKAVPSSSVTITIQSASEITATVQADTNGHWDFRPEAPLAPGKHTILIKALDINGVMQELTQSFTVYAEGSQFVEPSISPPPIPTPVLAPPTPASASPTIEIPTPTMTIPPTPTPTIIVPTSEPQPTQGVTPNAGNELWLFGLAGIIFSVGAGALLFFFI